MSGKEMREIMNMIDYWEKLKESSGSFWENSSPLQSKYEELFDKLVPSEGRADTLAGEVLRAASALYYDFYNNGFGNNMSGAVEFLSNHLSLGSVVFESLEEAIYNEFYDKDKIKEYLEKVVSKAIEFADKEDNQSKANTVSYHDYGVDDNTFYKRLEGEEDDEYEDEYEDEDDF